MKYTPCRGPADASTLIVGDYPTKNDLKEGKPFSGSGAVFFTRLLAAHSSLRFHECRATTALRFWPPRGDVSKIFHTKTEGKKRTDLKLVNGQYITDETIASAQALWTEIDRLKPSFVLSLGAASLWMLTGNMGITKWRGSMLTITRPWGSFSLLPTYSPGSVMKKKEWTHVLRHDLERIDTPWTPPEFCINTYRELSPLLTYLDGLEARLADTQVHLAVDVETRAGYITVLGFATSATEAHVIPLTHFLTGNIWSAHEEARIMQQVRRIFEHPNALISGQNFAYDYQYLSSLYGMDCAPTYDTLHMQHVYTTKNLPLTLDFLASLHCAHYEYWKDDGKDFHKEIKDEDSQQIYWEYNGLDCCRTWEVCESLCKSNDSSDWAKPVYAFQQSMQAPVNAAMARGTKFDKKKQGRMLSELRTLKAHYEAWFDSLLPPSFFPKPTTPAALAKYSPWYDSSAKQKTLFYSLLGLDPILERRKGGFRTPTCNDAALTVIGKREPALRPLCEKLKEYRSINLFISLYLTAPTSSDGRMRTSYDLGGTSTFRLASRKDPFDQGLNLQNITKGD